MCAIGVEWVSKLSVQVMKLTQIEVFAWIRTELSTESSYWIVRNLNSGKIISCYPFPRTYQAIKYSSIHLSLLSIGLYAMDGSSCIPQKKKTYSAPKWCLNSFARLFDLTTINGWNNLIFLNHILLQTSVCLVLCKRGSKERINRRLQLSVSP